MESKVKNWIFLLVFFTSIVYLIPLTYSLEFYFVPNESFVVNESIDEGQQEPDISGPVFVPPSEKMYILRGKVLIREGGKEVPIPECNVTLDHSYVFPTSEVRSGKTDKNGEFGFVVDQGYHTIYISCKNYLVEKHVSVSEDTFLKIVVNEEVGEVEVPGTVRISGKIYIMREEDHQLQKFGMANEGYVNVFVTHSSLALGLGKEPLVIDLNRTPDYIARIRKGIYETEPIPIYCPTHFSLVPFVNFSGQSLRGDFAYLENICAEGKIQKDLVVVFKQKGENITIEKNITFELIPKEKKFKTLNITLYGEKNQTEEIEIKKENETIVLKSKNLSISSNETVVIKNGSLFVKKEKAYQLSFTPSNLEKYLEEDKVLAENITIAIEKVPLYYVEGKCKKRLLGVFPVSYKVRLKISAISGKKIEEISPWWSKFAF